MTEFLPQDFEIMNYATSSRKTSFFTYKIICLKLSLDEDEDDIIGTLILTDRTLKKRIQDRTEVLAEFVSEDERIMGLKKYFGVVLTEKEQASIKGTVAELT